MPVSMLLTATLPERRSSAVSKADLLALDEVAHTGALESGGMDEHVLAAIIRLSETEPFMLVVEFDGCP